MSLVNEAPSGTFDLMICLDVIEHVADDRAMLADLTARCLRPGGWLLVSVPAWPGLFSRHDLELRHYRRYTPGRGLAVLRACGLKVVQEGGLFHMLALVRLLQIGRWGRAQPLDDPAQYPHEGDGVGLGRWKAHALVTKLIHGTLYGEGLLSSAAAAMRLELPGLSWWALCQKS
jgi:hypothetical protein